ncbi:hypothetical protein [Candidatus Skiveiella danica]|uniref:hypothetical protein n=1 Tax=Candidatus Skiveiella danica TaxID=3386177 RepID=UPI0039B945CE
MAAIGLAVPPGKAQGRWFLAGGVLEFRRTAGQRLHDRHKRLVVRDPQQGFGELALNQFGIGIRAFVALLALVMIAPPSGWRGWSFFKGDLFVASARGGLLGAAAAVHRVSGRQGVAAPSSTRRGSGPCWRCRTRIDKRAGLGLNCLAGGLRWGVAVEHALFLACAPPAPPCWAP